MPSPQFTPKSRGPILQLSPTWAPPWGSRTRRIPSPPITAPNPKCNTTRPSESVGGCLCSDRVIYRHYASEENNKYSFVLLRCASRRFLHIRYPNSKWGNSHVAPFRGAATPNLRYLSLPPNALQMGGEGEETSLTAPSPPRSSIHFACPDVEVVRSVRITLSGRSFLSSRSTCHVCSVVGEGWGGWALNPGTPSEPFGI